VRLRAERATKQHGPLVLAVAMAAILLGFGPVDPALSQPPLPPLKLDASQRQIIWENIWRSTTGSVPIGFGAAVGTPVPAAIKLQPMPQTVSDLIPTVRAFAYARTRNQILIVDPTQRTVVDVINR
jgi:hypothetical protein